MRYALTIAEDSRILSATFEKFAPVGAVLVDNLPEGNIADYRYYDGTFLYDPLPVPEVPETVTSEQILSVLLGVNV